MSTATLHYIHDPLCGWCYAAQPLVSAALLACGRDLQLKLHGGGLFAEPQTIDPSLAQHIMDADRHIADLTGQTFGDAYVEGLLADQPTTLHSLPPIAGVMAAEALDPSMAYPMLIAIQQAHYQRGLRVAEAEVLVELAEQIGLDGVRFADTYAALAETAAPAHVQDSRRLLGEVGGRGFPTLVLEGPDGYRVLPHGACYGRPDEFAARVRASVPLLH